MKILCLDFDGVLHSYISGWQGADVISDPPVKGAMEFLREAVEHFDVHIYSSRSNQRGGIKAMREWLYKWAPRHLPPPYDWLDRLYWPTEKPPAFIGIDDRVLTFRGRFPSMHTLDTFRPWNKT